DISFPSLPHEGAVLPAASWGWRALQWGPAGPGAPQKQEQSLALQCWQCHVVLSAVLPRDRDARGQEQFCACAALVLGTQPSPWDVHAQSQGGRTAAYGKCSGTDPGECQAELF
uniref:Uncharacterized protein n=1 Tax=Athene cunicularia TaxID=194338 RepID=A0A663MXH7_ATHCN